MNSFKIIPLSEEYAARIRAARRDDFGHEVISQLATGYGPCRVSLRPFQVGQDRRLLLSHSPFAIANAFNQPGPIFIHQEAIEAYRDIHRFPPEIKADRKHFPLTLIGYRTDQRMVFTSLVGDRDVDELIASVFAQHPEVDYLHARNAEAGCYICRIERV